MSKIGMLAKHQGDTHLRMAEVLASLSLAIDLGIGQPMEWVLRLCYLSLLRYVGCTATVATDAELVGDELSVGEGMTIRAHGRQSDVWTTTQALLAEGKAAGWGAEHAQRLAHLQQNRT